MTRHQKWVLHPFYPISLVLSQRKHTASKLAFHVLIFINKIYTLFAQVDAHGPFLTTKELFFKQSNFYSCMFYTPSSKTLEILCKIWVSEWVIKFNGLSGDSGQPGPYSPYKPCNHSLQIGIIIFPHIDTHNMRLKHDTDAQQCEIILMSFEKVFIAGFSLM